MKNENYNLLADRQTGRQADRQTGRQADRSELMDNLWEGLNNVLKTFVDEHCRKVLYMDITDDTFEVLISDDSDQEGQPLSGISDWFNRFADGPLCHDADRERFRKFTDIASLKAAFSKQELKPVSIVYRKKYSPEDTVFSTVTMELFPQMTEDDHLAAYLVVKDITSEILQYNLSVEENTEEQIRVSGKRTILIVEDNEMNREMLAEILSDDYQILQAENGAVGLEILQNRMMEISVIILDVQMPVMNGYEFLKCSQSDPFLSKIPVIVATGSNNAEEERLCLGLGASDFVSKPYNPDIIRSRIANIIRLKESKATMAMLQMDDVTDIFTLQAFCYHAGIAIGKFPEKSYAVVVLGIDHFRQINENYGEETGESILKQAADTLKCHAEESDIYGRYGADGFIMMKGEATDEELGKWVQELLASLKESCRFGSITFKAGIYNNIDKSLSISMICDRAVAALNSVGQNFEKRYSMYDAKHAEKEQRIANMEADMQEAYDNDQFAVYYQPKHNAATGALEGAEALIRWIHPTYGFMSPGEFIPLFERNGFISYADYYVLKRTCSNLRTWIDEGIKPVPISVNSSRRDFDRENYVETVMGPLRKYAIDPALIHIEVTESMFSDRLDEISKILQDCRKEGLKIELDDFGSGYSSLTTLASMPMDVMKLDMSFMKDYQDEKKMKILSTCIGLAKSLGMKTVSEGVEIEDQLKLLQGYGCDLIQGYYFSKPLPEKEFREYLLKHS